MRCRLSFSEYVLVAPLADSESLGRGLPPLSRNGFAGFLQDSTAQVATVWSRYSSASVAMVRRKAILREDESKPCRKVHNDVVQPPPTIGYLLSMGVKGVRVDCGLIECQHVGYVPFDSLLLPMTTHFPDIMMLKNFLCRRCSSKAVHLMPDWRGYNASGLARLRMEK